MTLAVQIAFFIACVAFVILVPVMIVNYVIIVSCSFLGACLVCMARDFVQLISLGMMFLMFISGIFWDVRALASPQKTELLLAFNPLAFVLDWATCTPCAE